MKFVILAPCNKYQIPCPGRKEIFNSFFLYFIFIYIFAPAIFSAQMAKLVDALVSETSVSNDVQVRVLFWAL